MRASTARTTSGRSGRIGARIAATRAGETFISPQTLSAGLPRVNGADPVGEGVGRPLDLAGRPAVPPRQPLAGTPDLGAQVGRAGSRAQERPGDQRGASAQARVLGVDEVAGDREVAGAHPPDTAEPEPQAGAPD